MPTSVEDFLAAYNPATRALAQELRDLIRSIEPNATERAYPGGWNSVRFGISPAAVDQVCYIAPGEDGVSLGFDYGTELPDTQNLLTGTGKKMRHIRIQLGEKPNIPYYRYLLEIAFAQSHGRHETRPVKRDAE